MHALAAFVALAADPGVSSGGREPLLLPAKTEVSVSLNQQLTSARVRQGQRFDVTVNRDVLIGDRVVIPRGTPGTGEVAFRTGQGAFGKSGKMDIVLKTLDLPGLTIPIDGRLRVAGRGDTLGTVGTIAVGGIVAGAFVKGKHAVIEQGSELRGYTAVAVTVAPSIMGNAYPRLAAYAEGYGPRPVSTTIAYAAPVPFAPVAYTPSPRAIPATDFQRKLIAERGVRGRSAQGWTISD